MSLRDIPNFITLFRLFLLAPFVYFLLNESYQMAVCTFFLAGLSDAADGYLARTYRWTSRFGALLDPIADKLLMLIGLSSLVWLGHIPHWLFALLIGRDVIILAGVSAVMLICGEVDFKPTLVSKVNTFLQVGFVCTLLFGLAFVPFPWLFVTALTWSMVATSIISVCQYVWLGTQQVLMR